jgi:thioredoxin-dependent peroxiredoxin
MAGLKSGEKAPNFKLQDQDGNSVKLADFKGKKLLVYFYPKADTPGCSKQACSVRDSEAELAELGVAAVGISPDMPAKQKKFDEKYSLGFKVLSDEDHAVAQAYGAWGEKTMFGKKAEGIIRSAFLIDEKGKIIDGKYKISPTDTVPFAVKALSAKDKKVVEAKPAKAKDETWTARQISSGGPEKITAAGVAQMVKTLKQLFSEQRYSVLATEKDGGPYGNLVAFAATDDLKELIFVTSRKTRKFQNIASNPKIAILVDNRSNEVADLNTATAVTAIGFAREAPESEREELREFYMGKHPNLKEFVTAKDSAVLKMKIEKYIVVSGLDNVIEMTPKC